MISVVTSVYDTVALNWKAPQLAINEDVARREFEYACRTVTGVPVKDIELFKIGEFDDSKGSFIPMDHKMICRGSDFLKGEDDE